VGLSRAIVVARHRCHDARNSRLEGGHGNRRYLGCRGLFSARGKVRKIVRDPPNLPIDLNQIALTVLELLMKANKAKDTPVSLDFDRTL
jgi:hypothetical protein